MPIYEYQCSACNHHLEAIQKMSDVPLTDCPKCHQSALHKLVSAAAFQLKGTGWYVTDYSAKGKSTSAHQAENAADSSGGSDSKSKDSKSTDSKSTDNKSTDTKPKDTSSTSSSSTDSGATS